MSESAPRRVAVIGAGWAGLAAAIRLQERHVDVTLFEASRQAGGRARHVDWQAGTGRSIRIDNGQHILIGAYRSTLGLMQTLGIAEDQVLLRQPLTLQNTAGFSLKASRLPAPFHLLTALLGARGLRVSDRIQALRLIYAAKRSGWRLTRDCSVSAWLEQMQQSAALCRLLWEPLCVAALNTPPTGASAQVFLNVLRDSVGASRGDSDLLLPKTNLSTVLPEAALQRITAQGKVKLGQRVNKVLPSSTSIELHDAEGQQENFDAAIIAVSAQHVPPLLEAFASNHPDVAAIMQQCSNFSWQPITTVYLLYAQSPFKPDQPPMLMLEENPAAGCYGQWVFDRQRLGNEPGLVAVVISADGPHRDLDSTVLIQAVTRQLQEQMRLGEEFNAAPLAAQVITEKRATFDCKPDLRRPSCHTSDPRLMLAGDYVMNDPVNAYPATLESAVRSGIEAADELML